MPADVARPGAGVLMAIGGAEDKLRDKLPTTLKVTER